MTYEIPLNASPAQSFSVVINDEALAFRLKTLEGNLYMDFYLNGNPVFMGRICKPNINLLKVFRPSGVKGRLVFVTTNNDYPKWENLGVKDRLFYVE